VTRNDKFVGEKTSKSKDVTLHAKQKQTVGRRIALPILHPSAKWGVGQRHAPAASPPGKEAQYSLYRSLGGPRGRSYVPKISPQLGLVPQTLKPVASRFTEYAIPAPWLKKKARASQINYWQ
jgi:hypothetical protein